MRRIESLLHNVSRDVRVYTAEKLNRFMLLTALQEEDIEQLSVLTPEGWDNIAPSFAFNLQAPFCTPFKALLDGALAGVGNIIFNKNTAWLAHIIVHPSFRNRGIGKGITAGLLDHIDRKQYPTVLLDATDMGYPVYHSQGFDTISRHVHFSGPLQPHEADPAIVPCKPAYRQAVLQLDREATGEDREAVVALHLENAFVYLDDEKVSGAFFPSFHKGLIIAGSTAAGLALLRLRLSMMAHAMVPEENTEAIAALEQLGFCEQRRSRRMCLGPVTHWQPHMLFNVSGGAMG